MEDFSRLHFKDKMDFLIFGKAVVFLVMLRIHDCSAYDPTVIMPYKEILGSSSVINIIGNTIQCTDMRSNIKTCAEDCFTKHNRNENCVGFLTEGNNCSLCKVLNRTEVDANQFTAFTNNHKLYLLKSPEVEPDIYISMDDFDVSMGTITGNRVSGGSAAITANDLIPGKVGQAIHFGGRIYPAVDQPECFCSFYCCNGTVSLSFWAKSYSTAFTQVITPSSGNPGLTVSFGTGSGGWFIATGIYMDGYHTSSSLSTSEWSFITYTVDLNEGISSYFNSIKEGFKDVAAATTNPATDALSCSTVIIGAKNSLGHYSMNGDLDEVKYFYSALTPAGMYVCTTVNRVLA